MKGKTCLITGATDGIGRATARELARKGAHVIIVGRSRAKGERVVDSLRAEAAGGPVEFELADLSDQAEIRELAARLNARLSRLDVLINNVGAYFQRRRESRDGIEMTLALNHLGYFLLTGLLIDLLKETQAARIVNVSSGMHRGPQIRFDDLQGERRYSGWTAYQQSKLANVLFTYRLADRLESIGVTANCLHPGFVATRFGRDNGIMGFFIGISQRLMAISEEKGAQTSIYLASSPDVTGTSGRYFEQCRAVESSPESHDRDAQDRLWHVSEEMVDHTYA